MAHIRNHTWNNVLASVWAGNNTAFLWTGVNRGITDPVPWNALPSIFILPNFQYVIKMYIYNSELLFFISDASSSSTVTDCSRPVPDLMCFLPAEKYLQCNPDIEEGQE